LPRLGFVPRRIDADQFRHTGGPPDASGSNQVKAGSSGFDDPAPPTISMSAVPSASQNDSNFRQHDLVQ